MDKGPNIGLFSKILNPPGLATLAIAVASGVAVALAYLWARDFSKDATDFSTALGITITLAVGLALWLAGMILSRLSTTRKVDETMAPGGRIVDSASGAVAVHVDGGPVRVNGVGNNATMKSPKPSQKTQNSGIDQQTR